MKDTSNKFLVRKDGDGWRINKSLLLSARLTTDELINLAAWCVALANPPEEEWRKLLADIRGGQS